VCSLPDVHGGLGLPQPRSLGTLFTADIAVLSSRAESHNGPLLFGLVRAETCVLSTSISLPFDKGSTRVSPMVAVCFFTDLTSRLSHWIFTHGDKAGSNRLGPTFPVAKLSRSECLF
jgi:hypothetical protein